MRLPSTRITPKERAYEVSQPQKPRRTLPSRPFCVQPNKMNTSQSLLPVFKQQEIGKAYFSGARHDASWLGKKYDWLKDKFITPI